ncbi:SnoaL-like domain-containing protein [Duganella sacchari]|uniref:SnoaL-like domain-containing protein n=1 Tax=Duganella sacchari TaxID=551987 RepID=A0A1M7MX42_9BURK|nr:MULTISPECIES: nuclear transport factor 2 family protein [Duganella]MYM29491.1 nuclear transport factor 2 family protein [Duganella sp. CY15W]SHM95623.1 SnoaL-like domain-containing protein [Duganella sacchari]
MNAANIATQYLAIWNERDAAARRALVAKAFSLDASYIDPMMRGAGHDGIDAMIAGAQGQFPGYRFELAGTPDGHNDVVRFSWSLAAPGSAPVAFGTDVAKVAPDGRLASITGFLDAA